MNQTAYNGTTNFIRGLPVIGGFCKFWFIPIEEVESMPAVDPTNQVLLTEIVLKAGKAWRGPVPVPDAQLGFSEVQKKDASGPYFETKVGCTYAGDIPSARANRDNMKYQQFMIVGKLRSTGFFVLIGTTEAGLDFSADFNSGNANGNGAITTISWTGEQIMNGLTLPSFNGSESGYVDFSGETISNNNDYWELE